MIFWMYIYYVGAACNLNCWIRQSKPRMSYVFRTTDAKEKMKNRTKRGDRGLQRREYGKMRRGDDAFSLSTHERVYSCASYLEIKRADVDAECCVTRVDGRNTRNRRYRRRIFSEIPLSGTAIAASEYYSNADEPRKPFGDLIPSG